MTAIGDTPQASRFIRTVPRCGYGFHGDAHDAERPHRSRPTALTQALASSRSTANGASLTVRNLIGRDCDCAVSIDSPGVSRRHARIVVSSGAATIEDLGSKNGTYVNDQLVTEATTLDDGSQMRIGPVTMVYRRMGALPSTVTQRQRKV